MKKCPQCGREYDNTMSFCLDDGAELLYGPAVADEPATATLADRAASAGDRFSESPTRAQMHATDRTAVLPTQKGASRKNSLIAGVVGILLVTALGVGSYFYYGRGSGKQIESIAVMPFVNESGNADVEYLSDGMTETLIASLSQLPNLSVKARSSVFRYKGKETDAKNIGKDLNVQALLNGRIAQRGDQLTLSLELIDSQTENVIWSDKYSRKQSDLVSLQSEIAKDISNKISTKLSGTDQQRLEKRPTENSDAYQLYLRGRWEWNKRKKDSLLRAVEYFKQAIALDPGFALAYSGLADCYIVFNTYEVAPPAEAYALARAAVQKALELDDSHGEAYAALASINDDYDWDFAAAEHNYHRAIELSPNYATAHQGYAEYLRMVGRFDEAVAQANQAIELDPVSRSVNAGLGEALYLAGRCDEAIPQFQKTIELDPGFHLPYSGLARCYALKGMYDEAIAEHRKAVERSAGSNSPMASLAYTLAKAGKASEAREILEQLEERRKSKFVDGAHLAPVYYALGDLETAFAQLDRSCKDRSPAVRYIKVDPRYGNDFRSDPRYIEVVRKIGLP